LTWLSFAPLSLPKLNAGNFKGAIVVHDAASRSSCRLARAFLLLRVVSAALFVMAIASNRLGAQGLPKEANSQKGSAPGILVMQNGRVVDGRISHCATGYMVEK
jgi:hypothetical protein